MEYIFMGMMLMIGVYLAPVVLTVVVGTIGLIIGGIASLFGK